ncbi:metallophosphoesterase 1 [Cloeon dipterum]|uniref:metallophosphoesterase 1 n=1 Tax=Cloeon dipterum TaxID=197152 RepID=UPI00322086DD
MVSFGGHKTNLISWTLFGVFSLMVYCEFLIYYVVLFQCSWPELNSALEDKKITVSNKDEEPVRAMFIADTHLLGTRRGHWFDKLRREWQMHRAFQSAVTLHKPDIVFVLGDVFDEGLWSSETEFNNYVARFRTLFSVPDNTELHVVVGNHDIGFHYGISPYLQERFATAMDAPSVQILSRRGVHFVLVNSMAMEGDGCFLCRPAQIHLQQISTRLKCTKGTAKCKKIQKLSQYSKPILLQHFPMFRESDINCSGPDQAPEDEKKQKFRERWECLSRESSDLLMEMLEPRLITTGHTHHGCHRIYPDGTHEWTVPSFSWRNKNNPSFLLGVFTANNYAVGKCYMPAESTVIYLYLFGGACITLGLTVGSNPRRWKRVKNS